MKKFALVAALLMASLTCQAIQQFQSDTTHEIGIDTNSNIFIRDPQTPTVTLNQLVTRGPGVLTAYQPTNTTGVGSTTILPSYGFSYETLVSSAGNLLMASTPTLSTTTVVSGGTNIADGTFLILSSTSTQTITLQDNGTLANSLLLLGANTRIIGNHKTIGLIFNAGLGKWTELFYANNN